MKNPVITAGQELQFSVMGNNRELGRDDRKSSVRNTLCAVDSDPATLSCLPAIGLFTVESSMQRTELR